MRSRSSSRSGRAHLGEGPTSSVPAKPDHGENSASTIVEAPQARRRSPLEGHDFPDGGGSGGAESFSRRRIRPAR